MHDEERFFKMKKHPKGNFRNSHPLLVLGTPNPSFPTVMGWGGGGVGGDKPPCFCNRQGLLHQTQHSSCQLTPLLTLPMGVCSLLHFEDV